jgi:hypothetical protein
LNQFPYLKDGRGIAADVFRGGAGEQNFVNFTEQQPKAVPNEGPKQNDNREDKKDFHKRNSVQFDNFNDVFEAMSS